jgi:hypothetical protein
MAMTPISARPSQPSLLHQLAAMVRPVCPDCNKRSLVRQETENNIEGEVAPRYYSCACCESRFVHAAFGPWIPANTPEFAAAFE